MPLSPDGVDTALFSQRRDRKTVVHRTERNAVTDAIGVTVVSPNFRELADEAEKRFTAATGLDVVRIGTTERAAFGTKLEIDTLVGARPIVYFDADWWLLRPFDFAPLLTSGKWCAVPDPGAAFPECFVARDIVKQGWEPDSYFNSGLFVCDLRQPEIKRVFSEARQHLADVRAGNRPKPVDSTDQIHFNWAVQQQPGLFKRLDYSLNCFKLAAVQWGVRPYPSTVHGYHAAGFHPISRKLEALKAAELMFGPEPTP